MAQIRGINWMFFNIVRSARWMVLTMSFVEWRVPRYEVWSWIEEEPRNAYRARTPGCGELSKGKGKRSETRQ